MRLYPAPAGSPRNIDTSAAADGARLPPTGRTAGGAADPLPPRAPVVTFSAVPARGLTCALRALALALAALAATPARAQAPRAPGQLVYVAVGDSTAVGVGANGAGYPPRLARRLEAEGHVVKLLNLGVSGATAADVRRDQLPRVMSSSPGLVTIVVGINDLTKGRTLAEFARDLQVIADLVKRTKATVVIATLPDLTLSPSGQGSPPSLARRTAQYNAAIRTVAERHGFAVVDLWEASRAAARADGDAIWSSDGFHPSALGYDRWAAAMWPEVQRAVPPRVQARRPPAAAAP